MFQLEEITLGMFFSFAAFRKRSSRINYISQKR